jgi:uncharacterized C2H2 Zn-finger protein
MIGTIIGIVVLVLIVVVLAASRRDAVGGPIQMSHLKCPKCGKEFDYAYLPGASMTSVRLGGSRFLRCPNCRKWSVFNMWKTRVDPKTHHCDLRVGPS